MSRLVTFAMMLLCLFSLVTCSGSSATDEHPYALELQQALDSSREAGEVIGVSAAIIDAQGRLWKGVSGSSHPGEPITEEMLFDMGSAGKMLAAPLMLDLAEEGLLSLDDPIDAYIDPPPGVDGSIPIRLLLNHTSGLANMVEHPGSPFRMPYNDIDFERWWTIDEIFTELGSEPLFAPGEGWHYSQAGYQIATLIVEELTGSTMAEQIQSRLLDPLDIQDMVLDFSKPLPGDVAIAHSWVDTEGDGSPEDVSDRSRNWIASLSRILYYTTAEDFCRWGHALFTGKVLEPASLDQMLTFVRPGDYGNEPPIFSGYGLGVLEWIPQLLHGEYGYGHSGSIPGYRAFLAHLPEHSLTIAVLSNSDKEEELGAVVGALLAVVLEAPEQGASSGPEIDLKPAGNLPDNVSAVKAFSNQKLFCERQPSWEVVASPQDWIDISLDWIVGADEALATEVWPMHTHQILVNGVELEGLANFTHEAAHYVVDCPEEKHELWAKGLSVYLPPLPEGEHEILWRSEVTGKFNNGFVEYAAGDYLEARAELTIGSP
jgi:D-alanyl-D-alanine carboxypeptidase